MSPQEHYERAEALLAEKHPDNSWRAQAALAQAHVHAVLATYQPYSYKPEQPAEVVKTFAAVRTPRAKPSASVAPKVEYDPDAPVEF